MVMRKGRMLGHGQGYYNYQPMAAYDKRVHSESAKGRSQPQQMPFMPINPALRPYSNEKLQEGAIKEHINHPKLSMEQARMIAKDHLRDNPRAYGKRVKTEFLFLTGDSFTISGFGYNLKSAKADAERRLEIMHKKLTEHGFPNLKKNITAYDTFDRNGLSAYNWKSLKGGKSGGKTFLEKLFYPKALEYKVIARYDKGDWQGQKEVSYTTLTPEKVGEIIDEEHGLILRVKKVIKINKGGKGIAKSIGRGTKAVVSGVKHFGRNVKAGYRENKGGKKLPVGRILPSYSKVKGERIRKGANYFMGDRIKKGNWSDKRWARARHKDNAQVGKKYEDWEKSKYQRWK